MVYWLLLNSQPRIMHLAYSDWFTQSWSSAPIEALHRHVVSVSVTLYGK